MILNLIKAELESLKCSTLVVFSTQSTQDDKIVKLSQPDLKNILNESIQDGLVTGKLLEVSVFREFEYMQYRHLVVIGLGKEKKFENESLRQAIACANDAVKSLKAKEVAVDLDGVIYSKSNSASQIQALVEGLLLSDYSFDELKSKGKGVSSAKNIEKSDKIETTYHLVSSHANTKEIKGAFDAGITLASVVNFSRRLGDMPANIMTPTELSEEAIRASKNVAGLKVSVWNADKCRKERMGGLIGVSNGSDQEPKFIIMEYRGAKADKKPVVFVGKGLTFDCGGISIKPGPSMEEMKYDMCGGANVIGALLGIAKLKLKINAIGLVPATENLVNGSATKPGDVHTARNGKTFEINNTDAEGRLILADALSYASELKPEIIIDAATLTGAIVVALGNTHTGFFTRNQALKNKIEKAAQVSGEWVWNMPLCDFHVKDMKGTFADLSNISSSKGAGSATAAAFLEQFVESDIPWAHFDIAGTAWAVGNRLNYCPKKGASGVMVRTFVELAKQFA